MVGGDCSQPLRPWWEERALFRQAGKTTLLNCLAAAIPGGDRVVSAEEVFELRFPHPGWVPMQNPVAAARRYVDPLARLSWREPASRTES